jgi:DNA-binding transcriptional LysR family regulator
MELRHFHSFIAVAEELNFSKAAKRLQIAQPPVSRHIRDLETELGVQLFDRNSSRVFLTDAGRSFLNEIRVVLQHVSQAVEAARQVGNGGTGTVRLGIGKGLGEVVSRIVNEYLRLVPSVEIDVRDIASGAQSDALLDRKIDVGFLRPPIDAPRLVSALLFQEPFSVVLRKSSPLANNKFLHFRHLANETLLLIERRISPGVYDRTLELFRERGIEPKVVSTATMPYEEAGSILVDSGKGIYVTVGQNPIHPSFVGRLISLPLKEPSALAEVHVVWRRDEQAKTPMDFVQFTRDAFQNKRGFTLDQRVRRPERDRQESRGRLSRPNGKRETGRNKK